MRALRASSALIAVLLLPACGEPVADPNLPEPRQSIIPAYGADSRGLRKVATFDARVLVLSRKDYDFFLQDELSEYAPVDLAVAWGQAARRDVREQVKVWQRGRFYVWHADAQAWQDQRVRAFGNQSANWHIIPADAAISRALNGVDEGEVLSLRGYLVDIVPTNGGRGWKTSRSRTDQGAGACEIFLVTELQEVEG